MSDTTLFDIKEKLDILVKASFGVPSTSDKKEWSDEFVEELLRFPNAAHDDQVDAMVMAIHYMKESWHLSHPEDPEWEEPRRQKKLAYWRI